MTGAGMVACLGRDLRALASYRMAAATALGSVLFQCALFWFVARLVPAGQGPLAAYGGDYFGFVVLGLLAYRLLAQGLEGPAQVVQWEAVQGTLEPGLVMLGPVTLLLGGSLQGLLFRLLEAAVFLAVGLSVALPHSVPGLLVALGALAAGFLAHLGLGLLGAGFMLAFKRGNPVGVLFHSVQGFLAGVWFPPELLPGWLSAAAAWLPLSVALRLARRALHGLPTASGDWALLALWAAALLGLGLRGLRLGLDRARREGSLGEF